MANGLLNFGLPSFQQLEGGLYPGFEMPQLHQMPAQQQTFMPQLPQFGTPIQQQSGLLGYTPGVTIPEIGPSAFYGPATPQAPGAGVAPGGMFAPENIAKLQYLMKDPTKVSLEQEDIMKYDPDPQKTLREQYLLGKRRRRKRYQES